jgi:hypothetical protein
MAPRTQQQAAHLAQPGSCGRLRMDCGTTKLAALPSEPHQRRINAASTPDQRSAAWTPVPPSDARSPAQS